ncbi:MAG: AIM24 family protein, partial [Actinobacteria bacterium]|nr:AIM24 family protein [Actinomycetota bacterium]
MTSSYTCRYCRLPSDASVASCPNCGAPVDVRALVSESGWVKQPPIADLARIQFGQSSVQVEGTQVPIADFTLVGEEWIYFSHHVLLWADPSARLSNMSLAGGWNRMRAGLPLIMVEARGPGHVALSDNHPGEVVALPIMPGRYFWVREHRFLCATGNVQYSWEPSNIWFVTGSGDDKETHYPLGQYGDVFTTTGRPGLLMLH